MSSYHDFNIGFKYFLYEVQLKENYLKRLKVKCILSCYPEKILFAYQKK